MKEENGKKAQQSPLLQSKNGTSIIRTRLVQKTNISALSLLIGIAIPPGNISRKNGNKYIDEIHAKKVGNKL